MAAAKKAPSRARRASTGKGKQTAANRAPSKRAATKKKAPSAKKTPSKKLRPKKKDTLTNGVGVRLPHKVSLAALNPFRLPVNPEQLALGTARYAGIFFVMAGGFFTLFHLHHLDMELLASHSFSQQAANTNTSTVSGEVVFDVPSDTAVSGTIDLHMKIDSAEQVYVSIQARSSDAAYGLGEAEQIDASNWIKKWDTTAYPDGEYQIQAIVDSAYETFDDLSDDYVLVDNSSATVDATPDVTFAVAADEPLAGAVSISAFVQNAHEVALDVFEKESSQRTHLGNAEPVGEDEWRLEWDTTAVADSDYKFRAVIKNDYGTYDQYGDSYFTVTNTEGSALTTTTDDTTTSDATNSSATELIDETPDPLIDLLPEEPLSGDALVRIVVEAAEEILLELSEESTGKSHDLGHMQLVNTDTWELPFDSSKYPDGTYRVIAHIKNAFTKYSDEVTTSLQNANTTTSNTDSTEDTEENTTTEETAETVLIEDDADADSYDEVLKPEIKLAVRDNSPLSGAVDLRVDTRNAAFVELYAVGRYALTERFLGLAARIDTDRWNFRWNTLDTPNGDYRVFARVKNEYGLYDSEETMVTVHNEIAAEVPVSETPPTQDSTVLEEESERDETVQATPLLPEEPDSVAEQQEEVETNEAEDPVAARASELIGDFQEEIDDELQRFTSAIRSGDDNAIERSQARLNALRERIIDAAISDADAQDLAEQLRERIRQRFARFEESTRQTEAMVRERVGDEITRDTDGDGITDYDEVHLYGTDPQSADSDNDGFIDGAEILSGFDPNDPTAEALVTHESPRENGVVREDLLRVENIQTATKTVQDIAATGESASALITGTALPNSFVTIYIFSTPIVVTVKADESGSWTYRFDKELENGEHEVYIGVTDNAGKLIAKSQPFRFVKEAQAFTPVDAAASGSVAPAPQNTNFATQNVVLIVVSLSVVGIGVTLIMIGMHLSRRREDDEPVPQTASAV